MNGAERIAAERQRQIEDEGFDSEHDDGETRGELSDAAACYAATDAIRIHGNEGFLRKPWPWDERDKRPRSNCGYILPAPAMEPPLRIRQLEKAGALIAAEIDRLLRKQEADGE